MLSAGQQNYVDLLKVEEFRVKNGHARHQSAEQLLLTNEYPEN